MTRTPRRRRRRRLWFLSAVAGLALVSPLESGLLPGRLPDAFEPPVAEAQSNPPYRLGTPDPCPKVVLGLRAFDKDAKLVVDDGTDANFPTLWRVSDDTSECILVLPACPVSPIGARLMWPSVAYPATEKTFDHLDPRVGAQGLWTATYTALRLARYPELCEDRVDNTETRDFERCRDEHVVKRYAVTFHRGGSVCRVLLPLECPEALVVGAGMHRNGAQSCRAVQRRGWSCSAGYRPANAFNSCYRETPISGTHPACGNGAPDFPLGPSAQYLRVYLQVHGLERSQLIPAEVQLHACAEYVGQDFTDQRSCRTVSGDPDDFEIDFDIGGNDYWCSYVVWRLRTECHHVGTRRPQDCSNAKAYCIKRASRVGGCDQIARTIPCRESESALIEGSMTPEQVREEGCDPCPTLPFGSDNRSNCPAPPPDPEPEERIKRVLRVRDDLKLGGGDRCALVRDRAALLANSACMNECADPPRGRIVWESEHYSGIALVNSAVVVRITDIPFASVPEPHLFANLLSEYLPPRHEQRNTVQYNDTIGKKVPAPRFTFFEVSPFDRSTGRYNSVSDMLGGNGSDRKGYECYPRFGKLPVFNLHVQELWPDQKADQDEIRDLFGADALDRWQELTFAERRAITKARGIAWQRPLTAAESAARCIPPSDSPPCTTWDMTLTPQQSMDRSGALVTSEIECRMEDYRTCIWSPPRPGYFKLTGAGAWHMKRSQARRWIGNSYDLGKAATWLGNNEAAFERLVQESGRNHQDFGLRRAPIEVSTAGWDLACFKEREARRACNNENRDWLYTEEATRTTACHAIDLRITCKAEDVGNYTETEPVGVIVHEAQVRTVLPSR